MLMNMTAGGGSVSFVKTLLRFAIWSMGGTNYFAFPDYSAAISVKDQTQIYVVKGGVEYALATLPDTAYWSFYSGHQMSDTACICTFRWNYSSTNKYVTYIVDTKALTATACEIASPDYHVNVEKLVIDDERGYVLFLTSNFTPGMAFFAINKKTLTIMAKQRIPASAWNFQPLLTSDACAVYIDSSSVVKKFVAGVDSAFQTAPAAVSTGFTSSTGYFVTVDESVFLWGPTAAYWYSPRTGFTCTAYASSAASAVYTISYAFVIAIPGFGAVLSTGPTVSASYVSYCRVFPKNEPNAGKQITSLTYPSNPKISSFSDYYNSVPNTSVNYTCDRFVVFGKSANMILFDVTTSYPYGVAGNLFDILSHSNTYGQYLYAVYPHPDGVPHHIVAIASKGSTTGGGWSYCYHLRDPLTTTGSNVSYWVKATKEVQFGGYASSSSILYGSYQTPDKRFIIAATYGTYTTMSSVTRQISYLDVLSETVTVVGTFESASEVFELCREGDYIVIVAKPYFLFYNTKTYKITPVKL